MKARLCFRGHKMTKVIDPDRNPQITNELGKMGFALGPFIHYCPTCNPELITKYEPEQAKPLTPLDAKLERLFGPRPPDLPNKIRKKMVKMKA